MTQVRPTLPTKEQNTRATIQPNPSTNQDTSKLVDLLWSNQIRSIELNNKPVNRLEGNVLLRQKETLLRCDTAYLDKINNTVIAWGNVVIEQADSTQIFSDSLFFIGDERKAFLNGEVVLQDGNQQLFTDKLSYNLDTQIAYYDTGGLLTDGKAQLRSTQGYYYVKTDDAYFQKQVEIINQDFTLRADSLRFNTKSQIANFLSPTLINQDDVKIYTEGGFYDIKNKTAEFDKNPQYVRGEQKAVADKMKYLGDKKLTILEGNAKFREGDRVASGEVIRYDEINEKTYLVGSAKYRDKERNIEADEIIYDRKTESYSTSGKTQFKEKNRTIIAGSSSFNTQTNATSLGGGVIITDTSQIIIAKTAEYNEETGEGYAEGDVVWADTTKNITIKSSSLALNSKTEDILASGRPLLMSVLDGDTLYLSADTLISFSKITSDTLQNDSIALDTTRYILGYRDVRIYKSNLQAICDSLSYNLSDSSFTLYYNPLLWTDTTQLSADTMTAIIRNNELQRVHLNNNSFIANSTDEILFNQVKGKNIIARFQERDIQYMKVNGNGQAIYYAIDEAGGYIAANKVICSDIFLRFRNNKLENIKFYTEPTSEVIPIRQVKSKEIELKGFFWEILKRPKSPSDLNSPHLSNKKLEDYLMSGTQ